MNLKKIKVYNLFWMVAAIILLIAILKNKGQDSTFDINVHDTYFVIADFYIEVATCLFFFLMGLGYWLIQKVYKKQLIKYLTIIHAAILIGSFILYWIIMLYFKIFPKDLAFPLFDDYQLINVVLVIEILLIVFIGIPVYIVNLLIAIFRKNNI